MAMATNTKCIQAGNQLYTNIHTWNVCGRSAHTESALLWNFLFFSADCRVVNVFLQILDSRRCAECVSLCGGVSIYILMVIDTLFCASCLRHIFTHRLNRCGGFQRVFLLSSRRPMFKHTQSSGLISCQLKLTRLRGGIVAMAARESGLPPGIKSWELWVVEKCPYLPNPSVRAATARENKSPWKGKSVTKTTAVFFKDFNLSDGCAHIIFFCQITGC